MNNVERDNIDFYEALLRCNLQQPVLPKSDLTLSLPGPPAQTRQDSLERYLGIPVIGLKEQNLASELQQSPDGRQILRVEVVAKNCGADDVIKAFRLQVLEKVIYPYEPCVLYVAMLCNEFIIKNRCCNLVLPS